MAWVEGGNWIGKKGRTGMELEERSWTIGAGVRKGPGRKTKGVTWRSGGRGLDGGRELGPKRGTQCARGRGWCAWEGEMKLKRGSCTVTLKGGS